MEITIANPYKGRLETIELEFTQKNTTWLDDGEKVVTITDHEGCLFVYERLGTYPVIVYDTSRADVGNDMQKAIRLKEEILNQWGACDPVFDWGND
jgi:hypothetical protein